MLFMKQHYSSVHLLHFLCRWYNRHSIRLGLKVTFPSAKATAKLIAPHGYENDDEKNFDITRLAADQLDCYAIVTQNYRKPL